MTTAEIDNLEHNKNSITLWSIIHNISSAIMTLLMLVENKLNCHCTGFSSEEN